MRPEPPDPDDPDDPDDPEDEPPRPRRPPHDPDLEPEPGLDEPEFFGWPEPPAPADVHPD